MRERKQGRKLLYPGGLISLSFLPFLFFASNQPSLFKEHLHALEVTYWDPADSANNPIKYVNEKFTRIVFTGTQDDKIKLDYTQLVIRELMHEADTTLGVEFTFKKTAKYSSLVRLYDLCQIEGVRAYTNFEDKFWVYNLQPKTISQKTSYSFCGTLSARMTYSAQPAPSYLISITDRPIAASLSLLLFIVMACITSARIILALCNENRIWPSRVPSKSTIFTA